MKAATLTALRGSIAHYDRMIGGFDEKANTASCDLCRRFWECQNDDHCAMDEDRELCPVREATGFTDCDKSPYYDLADHVKDCHNDRTPHALTCPDCLHLLTAERDFLAGLLPEDAP